MASRSPRSQWVKQDCHNSITNALELLHQVIDKHISSYSYVNNGLKDLTKLSYIISKILFFMCWFCIYIDGLVQDCSNSSAFPMGLLKSCTGSSLCLQMPRHLMVLGHQQAQYYKVRYNLFHNKGINTYFGWSDIIKKFQPYFYCSFWQIFNNKLSLAFSDIIYITQCYYGISDFNRSWLTRHYLTSKQMNIQNSLYKWSHLKLLITWSPFLARCLTDTSLLGWKDLSVQKLMQTLEREKILFLVFVKLHRRISFCRH